MLLAQLIRFLRQWRHYNACLQELANLDDRQLADIGLSRSDIPRVAWETAERASD